MYDRLLYSLCDICFRPSDFIVTELDVNGEFVTLECHNKQIKTTKDTHTKIEPHNVEKVQDNRMSGAEGTNEPESDSQLPQYETTGPHLEQLISKDVYEKLVSLADSCLVNASSEAVQHSVNLGERLNDFMSKLHVQDLVVSGEKHISCGAYACTMYMITNTYSSDGMSSY